MAPDFSDMLRPNQAKKRIAKYAASRCRECGGLCCAYNTSPVSHDFSISANMEDENIIQIKKALMLHQDFKKRFEHNVTLLIKHFNSRGFGRGMIEFVKSREFALEAVVQALWKIDKEIDNHNRTVYKQDPLNEKGEIYSDCLFLLPDFGCVMEEYRPYTCKTAFRKCFTELDLDDFVESNVHRAPGETIYQYLKSSLELDRERMVPVFLISSNEAFRQRVTELFNGMKITDVPAMTHYQLALLGDFVALPFIGVPQQIRHLIRREDFYYAAKVKDPPTLILVDGLKSGETDDDYTFGLDYVQCFAPTD